VKPEYSATASKSNIEAAFQRSAGLAGKNIQVESKDGKVTLSGLLHSWSQHDEAERTAWAAPGASENLIAVTPP
jgi:osmotically-inducible protein OsmY